MPELQRLHARHAPAVLAFELANRAYFAAFISDRGEEYFGEFAERLSALLAEQEAGTGAFYVLVAGDGSVLGRFNLNFTGDGTAELGYRVAQHAAGRGVATATVRELCQLAAARHGLRTLRAATSHENTASQKVLAKAGFMAVGPAGPDHLGGKHGTWYQRDLALTALAGMDFSTAMPDQPAALSRWHAAVQAQDAALLDDLLAEEVVFRSPAVFAPQEGKAVTTAYLSAALKVLGPSLRYVSQWHDDASAVLEFEASLDGLYVQGVDILRWNDEGKLTSFTVMVRPLRGLQKLTELMAAQLTAGQA